ncbi:hypothetical protein [Bremerella sp. P1]|uniref:hypothetical protein n=1 Tax=Bremerella sp. P1 TaxID=3026424 RepID=UPI002367CA7B|nr:hypothetical protein [Bremerella sp. P1]WDI44455.1 hypothetical protein PSR63_10975 [Bremerella sp. P1]
MDRSSIIVPLLIFIGINVGLDAVVGIAVYTSKPNAPVMLWHFVFVGLLWGQFGLCCSLRLRFRAMRYYAYIGMLLIPITATWVLMPTIQDATNQMFVGIVILLAGFTTLYCLGPRSLANWLSSPGLENRYTLHQMLIAITLVAFACAIVMYVPILVAVMIALGVFVLALPSVIASNLLAKAIDVTSYSWVMFASLTICILLALIEPMSAPSFGMYIAQIVVLWLGGILLISLGLGSDRPEVVGLPDESSCELNDG